MCRFQHVETTAAFIALPYDRQVGENEIEQARLSDLHAVLWVALG